ncbi:MAG: TetR/AcrR family transcriptional regulator [Spirochaetaceae bacterium]|jgi:AcrR family transcriptional regulator|nr:TetR/AcrR family transcriptional regulator [Spirochaetaceae bacterium]
MRIVKEPEERKSEILDAAEKLFAAKGYEAATVNSILEAVKIAKGTFYYYFKSKENVLDALIERRINEGMQKAEEIAASTLPPVEKLIAVIMAQQPQNQVQEDFNAVLHEKDNAKMHQKSLTKYIIRLGPCLGKIVQEGIELGCFSTPFPNESAEILLCAALVLFDDGYFRWTDEETAVRFAAFLAVMERALGAKPGSFSGLQSLVLDKE